MQPYFKDRLQAAKGIIWDLDNTLYRMDEALTHAFNLAVARAVIEAGIDIDIEEATRIALKSFEDHGYSGRTFIQAYGVDDLWLHHTFHRYVDETLIAHNAEVAEMFDMLGDVQHALITHGAGDWAMRVLKHLGLKKWFENERILAFEDYDFQRKSESPVAFEKALERLELEPKHVIMVEDLGPNLRIPYKMGMGTALIHHGQPPPEKPYYIMTAYDNAREFLQDLKRAKP